MADRMTLDVIIQGHDKASGTLSGVAKQAQRLETVFKGASDAADAHAKKYEHLYGAMRAGGAALTAGGAGLIGGLFAAGKVAADTGSALHDMSTRTGVSVETLSKLSYAAKQTGADMGNVEMGLKLLAKQAYAASTGSVEAEDNFKALGVSLRDEKGAVKDTGALFMEVGESLRKLGPGYAQAGLASRVFGRSGTMLIPIFNDAENSLAEFGAQAEKLGIVMSTKAAKAADDFGDAMDKLKSQVGMGIVKIGLEAIPTLNSIVKSLGEAIEKTTAWADAHPKLVDWIVKAGFEVGAFALAFGPVLMMLPGAIKLVEGLAAAYRLLAAAEIAAGAAGAAAGAGGAAAGAGAAAGSGAGAAGAAGAGGGGILGWLSGAVGAAFGWAGRGAAAGLAPLDPGSALPPFRKWAKERGQDPNDPANWPSWWPGQSSMKGPAFGNPTHTQRSQVDVKVEVDAGKLSKDMANDPEVQAAMKLIAEQSLKLSMAQQRYSFQ